MTQEDSVCTNRVCLYSLISLPWRNLISKLSLHLMDFGVTLFRPCPGRFKSCPGSLEEPVTITLGWLSLTMGDCNGRRVCGRLHSDRDFFKIERGAASLRRPKYERPYLKIFLWRSCGSLSLSWSAGGCESVSCMAGPDFERGESGW